MISLIPFEESHVVGLRIDGKIERDDFLAAIAPIKQKLEAIPKINLYVEMISFEGISLPALWEDIKFGIPNFNNFSREAVVTDRAWLEKWTDIGGKLVPGIETKAFTFDQIEEAKQWATAIPADAST